MLRLHEILDDADLIELQACGYLTSEEIEHYRDEQEQTALALNWDKLIKQRASALLAEQNNNLSHARQLRRDVIAHGGISQSDYEDIPAKYKRNTGQTLDCIAQEMRYADDAALMLDITGAENIIRQLPTVNGKRVQRFRLADVTAAAEDSLIDEHGRTWEDNTDDCPL